MLAAPPAVIVIFGAAGDLTKRKLIPALLNLGSQGQLDSSFAMVGMDRVEQDSATYQQNLSKDMAAYVGEKFDQASWDASASKIHYMPGDFRNADS